MQRLEYDAPATYRIIVLGDLDPEWSDRLNDMKIRVITGPDAKAMTTLTGPLPDQAALAGVLSTLYDLRLTLKSVERLGPPKPPIDTEAA